MLNCFKYLLIYYSSFLFQLMSKVIKTSKICVYMHSAYSTNINTDAIKNVYLVLNTNTFYKKKFHLILFIDLHLEIMLINTTKIVKHFNNKYYKLLAF